VPGQPISCSGFVLDENTPVRLAQRHRRFQVAALNLVFLPQIVAFQVQVEPATLLDFGDRRFG
jgi:hypothetical protein